MQRTRTYSWQDPLATAEAGRGLAGIDFLRAVASGELPPPPMGLTLGLGFETIEKGRVVFTAEPAEYHYNPIGVVHAGLAMTLVDSAIGCAVHSMLPAGSGYTSLETKVNFVRPITIETGPLRCDATVLHLGGRTATGEARLLDGAGKLYAHGTSTCLILRGPD